MREIKFRAWDTEDKVMRGWEELTLEKEKDDDSWFIGYPESKVVTRFDHLQTLEQYTGLHDKNGTEIYEGDVIENDGDDAHEVVTFDEGSFWLEGSTYTTPLHEVNTEAEEVIGNIHEQTHLLERD